MITPVVSYCVRTEPTFPRPPRIDRKGVENHCQSGQAAERRVVLCPELLREAKVRFHVAFQQGFTKQFSSIDGTCDGTKANKGQQNPRKGGDVSTAALIVVVVGHFVVFGGGIPGRLQAVRSTVENSPTFFSPEGGCPEGLDAFRFFFQPQH